MSNPELQALLANLRPRSQASPQNFNPSTGRDPSTSFPSASAVPSSPPPAFAHGLSTSSTGPNNAMSQSLLNLLNFSQATSQPGEMARQTSLPSNHNLASSTRPAQENTYTAVDLLTRASNTSSSKSPFITSRQSPAPVSDAHAPNPEESNQHGTTQTNMDFVPASPAHSTTAQAASTPQPVAPARDTSRPLFTYKNPFEALKASRPHSPRAPSHTTPQPAQEPVQPREDPKEPTPQAVEPEEVAQSIEDPTAQEELDDAMSDRAKLTPKSRRQETPAQANGMGEEVLEQSQTNGDAENAESTVPLVTEEGTRESLLANLKSTGTNEGGLPAAEPMLTDPDTHDTGGGESGGRIVPVISFPVKAFVSITLQLSSPATTRVRDQSVMEISRLKKEFDQIDRALAAASSKYITYALVKNGGMRIIRQDDGKDRHIFKHTHDRIFNVSVPTTSVSAPSGNHQAVLGTGVSGTVYYATVSRAGVDYFNDNNLEAESLIFPAYPQADENTAGGILKTRAKRSSRHPEFFAIGRGKAIHIVWPSVVNSPHFGIEDGNRQVSVEKLFQERPLQILTGKAGKDFNFSEDDTMVVSLDKTGRLRFWDIRKLIDEENARSVQITPYIIDTPILSLSTASPAEKSWPTSVLFVDKARPYSKGGALRYVLVGLRQNHTLQLWDIALGKAVQEINFPHDSETDGICSVAYHPATGIIVVGHPTRNSLFFIHLSAPRYVLSSSLSQASYVQRVAAKDPEVPKPESTACMSGIREISFEGRGQLRSVELLPVHRPVDSANQETQSEGLFELYIAHSTGVTCLVINREDLGWDADNKVVRSVNAEQEGIVILRDLKLGSVIEENTRSKSPVQELSAPTTTKPKKKKDKKAQQSLGETSKTVPEEAVEVVDEPVQAEASTKDVPPVDQPSVKESKKNKKKKESAADSAVAQKSDSTKKLEEVTQSFNNPFSETNNETSENNGRPSSKEPEQLSMSISGDWLDKEMKKIEKGVADEFKKELEQLYQNIKTDRASQDQASASRQEAVLRIVSSTLNTNVEKSLSSILRTQMQEVVVPSVVQTVSMNLSQQVTQAVAQTVKKELASELPIQVDRTLQSPQMLTRIADNVSTRINGQIQQEITKVISGTVATSMKNIASNAASEILAAAEVKMADQISQMQRQHIAFNDKIEQLNGALQSVAQTLQSMSQAQVAFQNQVLEDRRAQAQEQSRPQSVQHHQRASESFAVSPVPYSRATPVRPKTQAELEVEEVTSLMDQRRYEEGSIKWLQSSQPVKLFDDLFVRFTPDYLATDVSPLVAFSIGVTVANSLSTNTERRLEWINAAFDTVDFQDREIIELAHHAPQLINGLVSKLESLYMQRAEINPHDKALNMIPSLAKKARDLRSAFQALGDRRIID